MYRYKGHIMSYHLSKPRYPSPVDALLIGCAVSIYRLSLYVQLIIMLLWFVTGPGSYAHRFHETDNNEMKILSLAFGKKPTGIRKAAIRLPLVRGAITSTASG